MEINKDVLNKLLLGLVGTATLSLKGDEQLKKYVETGDIKSFDSENLRQMKGIFPLMIKPSYEFITKSYIPNIFVVEDSYYGN